MQGVVSSRLLFFPDALLGDLKVVKSPDEIFGLDE